MLSVRVASFSSRATFQVGATYSLFGSRIDPGSRTRSAQENKAAVNANDGYMLDGITTAEHLYFPLAFVDRSAEAFDVYFPNLCNHEALRMKADVKMTTPLAAQPPGTGKTVLGRNLIAVVRGPRESPEQEKEAARR